MKINEIVVEADLSRRGFLKGLGAAAVAGAANNALAQSSDRDTAIEAITKMAGTAWDMRRLGWSRAQAMTAFENQMGYKGELLRVAGLVCNFAWSVPKDHYTRNEFVSNVRQQATKNLPASQPTISQNSATQEPKQDSVPQPATQPTPQVKPKEENTLIKTELTTNITNRLKNVLNQVQSKIGDGPEYYRFKEALGGTGVVDVEADSQGNITNFEVATQPIKYPNEKQSIKDVFVNPKLYQGIIPQGAGPIKFRVSSIPANVKSLDDFPIIVLVEILSKSRNESIQQGV